MPGNGNEVRAVREANEAFYRAFESQDVARMGEVWVRGDQVKCVHPGWKLLCGWEAVGSSWEMILKNSGEMRFTLTDVRIEVRGGLAWVVLTENILSRAERDVSVTSTLATNLFERQDGRWRMVHHHASHVLTDRFKADRSTTVH